MGTTFSDKAQFSLREVIISIIVAFGIGAGIARFEIKTSNIESKLETLIAKVDTSKAQNTRRFAIIDNRLLAYDVELKSVTTSLTAIKPEEVRLRNRR